MSLSLVKLVNVKKITYSFKLYFYHFTCKLLCAFFFLVFKLFDLCCIRYCLKSIMPKFKKTYFVRSKIDETFTILGHFKIKETLLYLVFTSFCFSPHHMGPSFSFSRTSLVKVGNLISWLLKVTW